MKATFSYYHNWTGDHRHSMSVASWPWSREMIFSIGRTVHCTPFRPNLRIMFEFKVETGNIVKFSCLLCLPKKNVSPSILRQHVEVRTESNPFINFPSVFQGWWVGIFKHLWCTTVMTIVRFNKTCRPTYAGPFPVGECRCAGVGAGRARIFKFRSSQRNVG